MEVEARGRADAALEKDADSSSEAAASLPKPRLLRLDIVVGVRMKNEKRPAGQGDELPGRRAVLADTDQKNLWFTISVNERPRGSATRGSQVLPAPELLS